MTKVTLRPHMQAAAYIRGPKHAYAGTLLHTQLRVQRHKKGKSFATTAEVWNKPHIV